MVATHLHTYVATYMIYVATWFSLVQLLNVQANSYKVLIMMMISLYPF